MESADSCTMTIAMEYDENEFLWDVLYEFDADGNVVKVSCDGGASAVYASFVLNALNYCKATSDYCDSYLSMLLNIGGSVSYQYNDEGDCIYRQLEYKEGSGVNIIGSTTFAYEYEYIYDDDGNLSRKTRSSEEDDYYLITYYNSVSG